MIFVAIAFAIFPVTQASDQFFRIRGCLHDLMTGERQLWVLPDHPNLRKIARFQTSSNDKWHVIDVESKLASPIELVKIVQFMPKTLWTREYVLFTNPSGFKNIHKIRHLHFCSKIELKCIKKRVIGRELEYCMDSTPIKCILFINRSELPNYCRAFSVFIARQTNQEVTLCPFYTGFDIFDSVGRKDTQWAEFRIRTVSTYAHPLKLQIIIRPVDTLNSQPLMKHVLFEISSDRHLHLQDEDPIEFLQRHKRMITLINDTLKHSLTDDVIKIIERYIDVPTKREAEQALVPIPYNRQLVFAVTCTFLIICALVVLMHISMLSFK